MPAPISREYRIYLALWRKALHHPTELVVVASTFTMAVAMRQGMYRAIRPFRQGTLSDEELRKAADKLVVFLEKGPEKDQPHRLIFRPRMALAELDEMFDSLGLDEEDLLLGDERLVAKKLDELMEIAAVAPKKTAYYTRD